MTGLPKSQETKSKLQKWFGPNRDTHWVVAGAVGVILLGAYLVYSNHDTSPTTAAAIPAAVQAPSPMAPVSPPPPAPGKQSSE